MDIISPTAGFLKREQYEGNVELSFKAQLRFQLLITKREYVREQIPSTSGGIEWWGYVQKDVSEKTSVDKEINFKGRVYIKKIKNKEHYFDLKLKDFDTTSLYSAFYSSISNVYPSIAAAKWYHPE